MGSLLQQIRDLQAKANARSSVNRKVHIKLNDDQSITFYRNDGIVKTYRPTDFFKSWHHNKKHINLVMGPYSSGKSVGIIMEKLVNAINMPPCQDGIRRSRTLMTRTTYPKLVSSVIKTFLSWFSEFGEPPPGKIKTFTEKPPKYLARFNDAYGTIEWEVNFMAFEREDDVDKLGSIEFTDGFVNELRDFPKMLFDTIQGRIGRFPMVDDIGTNDYPHSLDCDTNAPTYTHWIKNTFEDELPSIFSFYRQAPGVIKDESGKWIENPYKENPYNSKDYYINFIAGKTNEFINVYARGEYGLAFEGNPVYPEYNDDFHSVDSIDYVKGAPLWLGFDFGLTPCLLVGQLIDGRLDIIKEFVTENFGIENLIEEKVKVWFNDKKWSVVDSISVADPAGNQRSTYNINLPTLIKVISETFTYTKAAKTNKEDTRLEAVRRLLNRNVKGKPCLRISRKECPILREGFNGKYYLGEVSIPGKGEKMFTNKPVKTHPHSEPQDCLQYIALEVVGTGIFNEVSAEAQRMKDSITGGGSTCRF